MSLNVSEGIVNSEYVLDFLLSGRCECAIHNIKTGNRFLYKVQQNKENKEMYFVKSITGLGDIYAGFIIYKDGQVTYSKGAKGNLGIDDIRIQALLYVFNHHDRLPPYVIVQHFGKCGRCGRKLTDLESVRRGLGPECAKKIF